MPDKWLPAEAVHMIMHPAETLGRKHNWAYSLSRMSFLAKQQSGKESSNHGQSWQKPNMVDSLDRK